ncbi:(R)-limonene synthase [Salix suchowensis]|nr:(R)-limonene synthase [Salix suchowensis]
MALYQLATFPISTVIKLTFPRRSSLGLSRNGHVRCMVATESCDKSISRRSGNYPTPFLDHEFLQSLTSGYVGEAYTGQANKLKETVKNMLENPLTALGQLELIDCLQRLGLAYQFEQEIKSILESRWNDYQNDNREMKEDLYATSVEFRLLRQHGYNVPQDVFNSFKDEQGNFKNCLREDIKGLLNLYEASYYLVNGESILEEARDFARKHLKEYSEEQNEDHIFQSWMLRMEARWFIDACRRKKDMNRVLLDFAELDFNMVQAKYQDDMRHASRWWTGMDLGNKLFFTRDRLLENSLWTVGILFEPQFGYYRKMETRVNALITALDDVYDVYGTLEELEVFTDVIERWNINALDQLPYIMKISFFSLFQTINGIGYDILKEQGINVVPSLKKLWVDLCRAYLKEAKWYYAGYTPSLQEYLDNAWLTSSGQVILAHAFLLVTNHLTEEAISCCMEYPDIIRYSSTILRLVNDLGTSSDEIARGDIPKSIHCYMHETGATEEEAREHIQYLIYETWKKLNEERWKPHPFSQKFMGIPMNLARTALCFYEEGDGYGIQDHETRGRLASLIVKPIPLRDM